MDFTQDELNAQVIEAKTPMWLDILKLKKRFKEVNELAVLQAQLAEPIVHDMSAHEQQLKSINFDNALKESLILSNEIEAAAAEADAIKPKLIAQLLLKHAALVDDKPMIGEQSIAEAIEEMKKENGNLFKSGYVGGIGVHPISRTPAPRPHVPTMTQEQYRKLRKEDPRSLGL